MPLIEQKALALSTGKVLDIGCGAGSHTLYLQEKGLDVTALDYSKGAIDVCTLRGVKNVVHSYFDNFLGTKFDTLLLLMNGIGIIENLGNFNRFFTHIKSLLKPNGQILLDSSDIIYMFEEDEDGGYWIPNPDNYYGEVVYTMRYKGVMGNPFGWLYVDYNTLQRAAHGNNFECELVCEGEHYDYLARLTLSK